MRTNEGLKMDEKIKIRSEEVRVKFHPDMKKRVDRISAMHGTPTSTWCHMVIAQAVVAFERQYQIQNKTQEAIVESVTAMLGEQFSQVIAQEHAREAAGQQSEADAPTSADGEGASE